MINKNIKNTYCYQYADSVIKGDQIASKYIIQASEQFMNNIEDSRFYFDFNTCHKVTTFFEKVLYVPELRKPVPLQLPHAFWLQQLYSFKVKETGLRKYTSMYMQVARKNFKTYYAAGMTNYGAVLGDDLNGEIIHGANSRDQALICTDMTGKLIKKSPQLKKRLDRGDITIFTYKKKATRIVYEFEGRFCSVEAMPSDPGDGGNPSESITDEFHEAKTADALETAESGQGQREQPLSSVITSPGYNKFGPCYQTLRNKSVKILSGVLEDHSHLPIMFELDHEQEWDDINALEKSNCMMPYSKTLRPYLERRIKKAKAEGGTTMVNVKIKNSGIWVDSAFTWIPTEKIKLNSHAITLNDLDGLPSYGGLDLSAGADLNAFINFVPNASTTIKDGKELPVHAVYAQYWIPKSKVENQKTDAVDYQKWVDEGWIKVFDGDTVEYSVIADDMVATMDKLDMRVLGADSKYLRTGPAGYLQDKGYLEPSGDYEGLVAVGQGFNLTAATAEIELWCHNYQLDFMGNPVTEWCFSNVSLHMKDMQSEEGGLSGHRYPSKGKSNGRIDGVSALCTAVTEYLRIGGEAKEEFNFTVLK